MQYTCKSAAVNILKDIFLLWTGFKYGSLCSVWTCDNHYSFQSERGNHSEDSGGFRWRCMGITQIKEWNNRFKDSRISVDSEPRSGRSSKSRNDQVIAKVNAVVKRDVGWLSDKSALFSVHSILSEDLAMKRVTAKFLALDSDFSGEKPDYCGFPGSLLSWYGSLWLLVAPKFKRSLSPRNIF